MNLIFIRFRLILLSIFFIPACLNASSQNQSILSLLNIKPSKKSQDYVNKKKQFQLQNLVTEQRHPKTYQLSYQIEHCTQKSLESLFSVDEDISKKLNTLASDPHQLHILEQASIAIQRALMQQRKVYLYGTGATGRLAKQVESALWRPFWEKVKTKSIWDKLKNQMPAIENSVIGEITGGDRALVSSLEGFEDLPLIGKLQLENHHINKEDVVFAVTEGGETSAVIGTVLAAAKLNNDANKKNVYFIYNNPDSKLKAFHRSNEVLQNPAIVKINLTTGPQAITGSTRMQATTIELFVMGALFENALYHLLKSYLSETELKELGFDASMTLKKRLLSFEMLQKAVYKTAPEISHWTELETKTYASSHYVFYFAKEALLQVFTDITERSPTFRLSPLDQINAQKRMSWIQVWTPADNPQTAWSALLHRSFTGLEPTSSYELHFKQEISDPYLREAALRSLKNAGNDQKNLYDFSFSPSNVKKNQLTANDLGVLILLSGENSHAIYFKKWIELFTKNKTKLVLVNVTDKPLTHQSVYAKEKKEMVTVNVVLPNQGPLGLNQQIGLKMILNAHSTAVMAKLGRVVGNTMTYVHPSNLKLIGRATHLIQIHVNDALTSDHWLELYGKRNPLSYREVNAILFDAIDFTNATHKHEAEVALSIVRILETLKHNKAISWDEADIILKKQTLANYLKNMRACHFKCVNSHNQVF